MCCIAVPLIPHTPSAVTVEVLSYLYIENEKSYTGVEPRIKLCKFLAPNPFNMCLVL